MNHTFSKYLRNTLTVIGALSVLYLLVASGIDWVGEGLCKREVFKTATSSDGYTKATVYEVDCGAMAATRTYVALGNAKEDGSKKGEVVVTFLKLDGRGNDVELRWTERRLLTIAYPAEGEVEYSVGKTKGVAMQLAPVARPVGNS